MSFLLLFFSPAPTGKKRARQALRPIPSEHLFGPKLRLESEAKATGMLQFLKY
jgi:hypothetical protein